MCLVEFGHTSQVGSLVFGFTAASGGCITDPLHNYYRIPLAVTLSLYTTALDCGSKQFDVKKIMTTNEDRRVAMLFHRTAPLKARVRLFVTMNQSFGENPKPYHTKAAEFTLAADTEQDTYIPCGNVFDKATCTIFSVALNNDIPPQFLAYI